jgi:hypothetical protein
LEQADQKPQLTIGAVVRRFWEAINSRQIEYRRHTWTQRAITKRPRANNNGNPFVFDNFGRDYSTTIFIFNSQAGVDVLDVGLALG